jgi:dTDP-4-dehydrorhamnose reductase
MNKKILTIGGAGLVGSRIVELLSEQYEFSDMSRSSGLDITDKNSVLGKLEISESEIVINFAAKADVDGCEKDKLLGKEGNAWKINADGAANVAFACARLKKKLIQISTDFVFGANEMPSDGYTEEDIPKAVDWYGATKLEGENAVKNSTDNWIIARIAYPYRKDFTKKDFARIIKARLESGQPVAAITDHIMTPTFIDDIAKALDILIQADQKGIFNIVGSEFISPYEASMEIARVYGLDKGLVSKTTREDFFKDRAPRPFQLGLNNDKIEKLGVHMSTLTEGLEKTR